MANDELMRLAADIGAKGADPTEADRLSFEAWMRGHCWEICGEWTGKTYQHPQEDNGFLHAGTMNTRRLFAAWRDRGALERDLAQRAPLHGAVPEGYVLVKRTTLSLIARVADGDGDEHDIARHIRSLLAAAPAPEAEAETLDESLERTIRDINDEIMPPAGQPEGSTLTWVNPAPHASAPMEPQRTANYPIGFQLDESKARAFLGQPDTLGMPDCGKPLCTSKDHHPLCGHGGQPKGVEVLLRSENPDRKDFSVAEALRLADQNDAAYRYVPSVSRTLAAEVRRLASAQRAEPKRIAIVDLPPSTHVDDGLRQAAKRAAGKEGA